MEELLFSLEEQKGVGVIFTMPNADPESRELIGLVNDFVSRHPGAKAFSSLGHRRYLSCIRYLDGVVGNSSSGLLEVPVFKKGTVNIGDRQGGRLRATSVIDCLAERKEIADALQKLYSEGFQKGVAEVICPYGEGGASGKILEVLREIDFAGFGKKDFLICAEFFGCKRGEREKEKRKFC